MKKLLIALSLFVLPVLANAQDSTSYAQFRYDFMNVEIVPVEQMRFVDNLAFKPALILLGTFAINHVIINTNNNNHKNTSLITGTVFLAGVTASIITYSCELKKYHKKVGNVRIDKIN